MLPNSRSKTYRVWHNMKQRCTNSNRPDYKYYGGRGIGYCKEWENFINFYNDMGDKPEKLSLERINVDEDYSPENCIWANETTQNYHQRIRKDNSSGVSGVHQMMDGYWVARLWKNRKLVHYSRHSNLEDAIFARKNAEINYYGYEKSK